MGIPLYGGGWDSGPTKQANSSTSFHTADPVRISEEWCVNSFHVILFFSVGFSCGLWQAVIDFRCWSVLPSNAMMRKRKRWREMHLQFPIKRPLCSPSLTSPPSTPPPGLNQGLTSILMPWICVLHLDEQNDFLALSLHLFLYCFVFFPHFFQSPASSHCAGRSMRKSRPN